MNQKKRLLTFLLLSIMLVLVPGNVYADQSLQTMNDTQDIVDIMPDKNLRNVFATMLGYESSDELTADDLNNFDSLSINPSTLSFFDIKNFKGIEKVNLNYLSIDGLNIDQTELLNAFDFSQFSKLKKLNAIYFSGNTFKNGIDFNTYQTLLDDNAQSTILFMGNTLLIDKNIPLNNYTGITVDTKDWGIVFPQSGAFEFKTNDYVSVVDAFEATEEFSIINEDSHSLEYIFEEDSQYDLDKSDTESNTMVPSDTYKFTFTGEEVSDLETLLLKNYTSLSDDGIHAFSFGVGSTILDGNTIYAISDNLIHLNVRFKHQSDVLIHYVDEEGNTLLNDSHLTGEYGDAFTVDSPQIKGYTYVSTHEVTSNSSTRQNYSYTYENREFQVTYKQNEEPIINTYTVVYTDGVDNERVFEDQIYKDIQDNSKTPGFVGSPTRKGYKFIVWNPEVEKTVTKDAVYTAMWEKIDETVPTPENLPNTGLSSGVMSLSLFIVSTGLITLFYNQFNKRKHN